MICIKRPETRYMTLADTRRWSVELPFADPYTGAPYGQKRGPMVAVAGAIGSISAGASIGGFVGGMMIAGGIASAVGTLSGNKTLSMLGTGLSLAGGIGTAFVTPEGAFMNPFAEGASFGDSVMGGAFSKVKNFFSDATGSTTSAADALGASGKSIVDTASDVIPDVSGGTMTQSLIDSAPTQGIRLLNESGNAVANAASSGGGLLGNVGKITDSVGALGALSGLSDGYNQYEAREQAQPLFDARVDSEIAGTNLTNAQTGLLQQRYENMQAQPGVGVGVNPNAQVFNKTPGSAPGKYAVVVNGEVKYLNQAEYDAYRNQTGGGLLAQGA